jgi:anthranilate phosphoribosyltransferase
MSFDARPYLKEIARGSHGARDLTREQARTLFEALFAGELDPVAVGALLVALRVKGENAAELAGMMDALAPHVRPIPVPTRRALPLVIPTYNGSRKLPNLVPLLALLLAREGVPVVLHGVAHEAQRVSTFEILDQLDHAPVRSGDEAGERLERASLAVVPIAMLSPALARLLALRLVTGVRNSGHTLAKLLLPEGVAPDRAFRLIAVTHPDFQALMLEHFALSPAHAFLMRGMEGEPVVRLHAPQPIEQLSPAGERVTRLMRECEVPPLPERDASSTARWTAKVMSGEEPIPAAIAQQVALLAGQCREAASSRPLRLVS